MECVQSIIKAIEFSIVVLVLSDDIAQDFIPSQLVRPCSSGIKRVDFTEA
jgi:hypothetical protein